MLGGSDIKKMAAGLLHHHSHPSHHSPHHTSPSSSSSNSSSVSPETVKQQEKQFITRFCEQPIVLPPDKIQQDPRNKELGGSSKALSVRDFELVRTLGTGAFLSL
jgi:protein kinase A